MNKTIQISAFFFLFFLVFTSSVSAITWTRSPRFSNTSFNESLTDARYLKLPGDNANQDINISPYDLFTFTLNTNAWRSLDDSEVVCDFNQANNKIECSQGLSLGGNDFDGVGTITATTYFDNQMTMNGGSITDAVHFDATVSSDTFTVFPFGYGGGSDYVLDIDSTNAGLGGIRVLGNVSFVDIVNVGTGAGSEKGNTNLIRSGSSNAFLNLKGGSGRAAISLSNDRMAFYGGSLGTRPGIHFRSGSSSSTNQGSLRLYINETGDFDFFNNQLIKIGQLLVNTDTSLENVAGIEVYENGAHAELLIHEDAGTHEARVHLRRGSGDWEIINNGPLGFEFETKELFKIGQTGATEIIANTSVALTLTNNEISGEFFHFYNQLGNLVFSLNQASSGSAFFAMADETGSAFYTLGKAGMLLLGNGIELSNTLDPLSDVDDEDKYGLLLRNTGAIAGTGTGIGFVVTGTTDIIGASIIHERTGSNSLGNLMFFVKNETGGEPPVNKFTMHPDGIFEIKEGGLNQSGGNATINNIYGSIVGDEIGDVTIGTQGLYHNVTNVTAGFLNGFTFNASGIGGLTAQLPGIYQVNSGWSFSGSANTEYHIRINKNNVEADNCHAQRKIGTGADVGSAATVPCLVDLAVGDVLSLAIENVDNTNDATINDIGMTVVRVGNV